MTLADAARQGAARLEAAGFDPVTAAQEAGLLARTRLGWDAARWLTDAHQMAGEPFTSGLSDWIARRARREPVAYILGVREFYGRPFHVTPAVLVPRPETELVIDTALDRLRAAGPRPAVLDVGTGSGCLAVTLALERPDARVTATDVSTGALAVAADNARRHGVGGRITFVQASLTAGAAGTSDLVVANPPYVPEADRDRLPPDVRDHEPALALFGGPDGLDVIRALLPAAAHALVPGGCLLLEIGAGQADAVRPLVAGAGLVLSAITPDLAGIPRLVVASRPGEPV